MIVELSWKLESDVRMEPCVFCRIGRREIPADVVYDDDHLIAFNDINPQAPVHILVVPKEHIPSVSDIVSAHECLIGKVYRAVSQIAREIGIAESGFRVVVNCGRDGGQTVPHLHFHLLGGRGLGWPPG